MGTSFFILCALVGGLLSISQLKNAMPSNLVGGTNFSLTVSSSCTFLLVISSINTQGELFFCSYYGSFHLKRLSTPGAISSGLKFYQKNNVLYGNREGVMWNIVPLQNEHTYQTNNESNPSEATEIKPV